MPPVNHPLPNVPGVDRDLLQAQLAALVNPCACRANAQCWALMQTLARVGALPTEVLTMTPQEWAAGCGLPVQLVAPVTPPSPPSGYHGQ